MIKEDQDKVKEIILQKRKEGETLKGCAIYGGVSEDTLARWRAKDKGFADKLSQARRDYRGGLVKITKQKDSKFLLERQFREEFLIEKDPESTNNYYQLNVNLDDKQRQQRIVELEGRIAQLEGSDSVPEIKGAVVLS